MLLHRIGAESFNATAAAAFSGQGGLYGHGRWHHRGRPIVYTASSLALATLEILVHIDRRLKIQPFVSWNIAVPDALIADAANIPADWRANLDATRAFGTAWLESRTSVALRIPSVLVPSEYNVLLNPQHPAFDPTWPTRGPAPVTFDFRLIDPQTIKP